MAGYNLDESKGLIKVFSEKSISKILKSSDTVQLKHYNLSDTINALVTNITGSNITIQPKCNRNESFFFPNDPVVLNLTHSGEYYTLSGEISSITSLNPSEIVIKVSHISNQKNARKTGRFYVSLVSEIKTETLDNYEYSISKNLSLSGIKINCKLDLPIGEIIYVSVNLDNTRKFTFKGKIVRKNTFSDFFEYGIEMVFISKANQLTLFHYIGQLETQ